MPSTSPTTWRRPRPPGVTPPRRRSSAASSPHTSLPPMDNVTISADTLDRARDWAAEDPDVETRTELERLVALAEQDPGDPAAAQIADRFAGTLQFGTA